jgi:gamma-glutamyl-gamma-aminobutyrate hydrolase PuuD
MPKVFIINPSISYIDMFQSRGWEVVGFMDDADLIQFTGGEDVSPHLYGELPHPETYSSGARDECELELYELALRKDIPMAGVCRGGQFLHVMNGGDLWQHVHGHALFGTHKAYTCDSFVDIDVTSTHHQAMRETCNIGGLTILVADTHGACEHMLMDNVEKIACKNSLEAVYYARTSCLCFQPHPEFRHAPKECTDFYFNSIYQFFGLQGEL